MGIEYKIGTAKLCWAEDSCWIDVEKVDDVKPGCGSNTRMGLSYSFADTFEKVLGVQSLFAYPKPEDNDPFDEAEPLMVTHPGAMPVLKEHSDYFDRKLAEYKNTPNPDPQILRVAEWFSFWLRYAAENLENPVLANF